MNQQGAGFRIPPMDSALMKKRKGGCGGRGGHKKTSNPRGAEVSNSCSIHHRGETPNPGHDRMAILVKNYPTTNKNA